MNDVSDISSDRDSPAEIYGENYYRCHCGSLPYDRSCAHWAVFFGGIADTLVRSFRPRTVFDAGCAMGFLVEAFWDRGVEAWGRDISEYAISQVRPDLRSFCSVGSIAMPFDRHYDLITCIEVVEHMPEAAAKEAIKAIAAACDRVLFSSSPNDFEEPTHINVKPVLYWLRLFAAESFAPIVSFDPVFVTPHCVAFERVETPPSEALIAGYAETVRLRLQSADRDATIRHLYGQIQDVTGQLEGERRAVADAEQRIAGLNQKVQETELGAQETELRALKLVQRTTALEAEITNADGHAKNLEQQLGNQSHQIAALRTALLESQSLHQAVLASTSWRLTHPVRQILAHTSPGTRRVLRRAATVVWWALTFQAGRRLRQRSRRRISAPSTDASPGPHPHVVDASIGLTANTEHAPSPFTAFEQAADTLPWIRLLRLEADPALADRPALNVLLPGLAMKHMSGGPNTVINLACRLAATGIPVRLIATGAPIDADPAPFWQHAVALSGVDKASCNLELVDGYDRTHPLRIGVNDIFVASAWWTAHVAKHAVRHTRLKKFFYVIQDFESLLHPASTQQALAEETYRLDYIPIINTRMLFDFMVERQVGRFADPEFHARAIVFDPAIDTTLFYPVSRPSSPARRKRLLFYARPTNGLRNLFEIGVAAIKKLVADGVLTAATWDINGMGESFEPIALGNDCWLRALPWKSMDDYAKQMRESDVLVSLMMSPHPSYPPLEMAACGSPVVTTTFANKDAASLAAISPNIIGVEPTLEAVLDGIIEAMRRGDGAGGSTLPSSWTESFADVIPKVFVELLSLQGAPSTATAIPGGDRFGTNVLWPGFRTWPNDRLGIYRQEVLEERRDLYNAPDASLFSFITTVWNTDPKFVRELAETVFNQDAGTGFEWVILDNGSARADTRDLLNALSNHPSVRLFRVEQNIGIVPGLRYCLERARNRYIVPLDSDDLLMPDCVRVFTAALRQAGFPSLAYSDEDKIMDDKPRDLYSKPDFDPVLFVHSCYIAHLCALDREQALALGCYTNPDAEGSSDWDSFTRFWVAGHIPFHVPELLYTWRMHMQSTAMNIDSKSYIHSSQLTVLNTFLAKRAEAGRYEIQHSALFAPNAPDWRVALLSDENLPLTTVIWGPGANTVSLEPAFVGHSIIRLESQDLLALQGLAREIAAKGCYIHILAPHIRIDEDSWAREAISFFELHPDTAIVGGRIHRAGEIVAAGGFFGFSGICSSPDVGKRLNDPGYFAQLWKPHSVSTVPLEHCVMHAQFLVDALAPLLRANIGASHLSLWLGAAAKMSGKRCVYSPFLSGVVQQWHISVLSRQEEAVFRLVYPTIIPETAVLSLRLGLTPETAYQPVLRATRESQLASASPAPLPYPDLHMAELAARRFAARDNLRKSNVCILTTVYSRTDAALLRETAATLLRQSLPFDEWIILAHGPTPKAVDEVLESLLQDHRIVVLREPVNLGIIGGMQLCLAHATQRYVIPVDADDLLTDDAVEEVVRGLSTEGAADFIFSDEDILSSGKLSSPIRRGAFDPLLNDADSTIWHLCAFDREQAIHLGVYSDPGAEFCHDWDTLHRFADSGKTVRHVPHILYHWRHHASSTSNSGVADTRSLDSVRHVLERIIARQANPEYYTVSPFPISRGTEQLAILRKPVHALSFSLIYVGNAGAPDAVIQTVCANEVHVVPMGRSLGETEIGTLARQAERITNEFVVVLDSRLRPADAAVWDAMRIFEMHPDVIGVGGRILDHQDLVVDTCEPMAGRQTSAEWIGQSRLNPGSFAMALKCQSCRTLASGFFFCRTGALRTALAAARATKFGKYVTVSDLFGTQEPDTSSVLGYSPLVEATIREFQNGSDSRNNERPCA